MTFLTKVSRVHPAPLVLLSFLFAIAVGTVMLKLPISTTEGSIRWVDAFFTITSAVCVTGLAVVDIGSYFTLFGQWVILGFIQIGGLGVMTISVVLFELVGRTLSIRQRMVMQDLFAHTPRSDILGVVKSVLLFTFAAEMIGAVLLAIHWCREMSLSQALYNGIFHSVSAFCNAGFGLFPDNLMKYSGDYLLNITICGLIIIGGIGFPVLYDVQTWWQTRKKGRARLSIQTKTVVLTTLILIFGGAIMIALLEQESLRAAPSVSHRILIPFFQSVTCRTAGFNTVDIGLLKDATLFVMIVLMFFGASPGSCGGGVKTTTLALIAAFTFSRIRRKVRVNLFKKSVPTETVNRSLSLILISIGIIGVILFMLMISESVWSSQVTGSRNTFLAYLFETVSAFGTVGLSMGITSELSSLGKCWIAIMMIIGRIGVLTFSYIIVGGGPADRLEYSEENMMIG
jgi:trk system potassium uptake protein